MKNRLLYLFYIFLITFSFYACTTETELLKEQSDVPEVSFVLSLGESVVNSRVTIGEDTGTYAYDNQIDPADLRVILYDSSTHAFLGQVESMSVIRINTNTYQFIGQLNLEAGVGSNLNCNIMVFANCGDIATMTNKGSSSSLQNLTYNYLPAAFAPTAAEAQKKYIPMWGVKSTSIQITKGSREDLGSILLLRSMTKISVSLDSAVLDWSLNSVQQVGYTTTGLLLPSSYQSMTTTTYMNSPSIPTGTTIVTTPINYSAVTTGREYVIYIPEYKNINATQKTTIQLNLKRNSDSKNYILYFKDYSGTDTTMPGEWDLVRNYYYQFKITGISEDIKLYYTVEAWTTRTVTIPGFE